MKILSILFLFCAFITENYWFAQQQLTPRLIFDFNVGDEFHYSTSAYYNFTYSGGFKRTILEKYISTNNDSISYIYQEDRFVQNMNQSTGQYTDTSYFSTIDTLTYTLLDSLIQSTPYFYPNQQLYNTLFSDSLCVQNLSYTEGMNVWNNLGIDVNSYSSNIDWANTCFSNGWSTYSKSIQFGKGVGTISQGESQYTVSGYGSSYSMVYFKKDTIAVGTPFYFLNNLNELSKIKIELFPNPVSDFITIRSADELQKEFKIFDYMGNEVFFGKLNGLLTQVNLSNLSNGLYTLKINGVNISKRILKV